MPGDNARERVVKSARRVTDQKLNGLAPIELVGPDLGLGLRVRGRDACQCGDRHKNSGK